MGGFCVKILLKIMTTLKVWLFYVSFEIIERYKINVYSEQFMYYYKKVVFVNFLDDDTPISHVTLGLIFGK